MSLYSHLDSKDAVLDGIVEAIWSELIPPADAAGGWQDTLRTAARSIRATLRRHPQAAPLLAGRAVMPRAALEAVAGYRDQLQADGFDDHRAVEALRVVLVYALGYSLTEIGWDAAGAAATCTGEDDLARLRRVTAMVPPTRPTRWSGWRCRSAAGSTPTSTSNAAWN
jgi:AcrR family transcriptional regulator